MINEQGGRILIGWEDLDKIFLQVIGVPRIGERFSFLVHEVKRSLAYFILDQIRIFPIWCEFVGCNVSGSPLDLFEHPVTDINGIFTKFLLCASLVVSLNFSALRRQILAFLLKCPNPSSASIYSLCHM